MWNKLILLCVVGKDSGLQKEWKIPFHQATERLSIWFGRKGYALKAMPKAFFTFTGAHYLIFLVVFRFSILLLMKQILRVKRIMHDWKVSPKALWRTIVYTIIMVNDIYTHICCNDFFFLPHFFHPQLFIYYSALAWPAFHIWQIYASQSSHNAVQTYYINMKVPYALFLFLLFLSLPCFIFLKSQG